MQNLCLQFPRLVVNQAGLYCQLIFMPELLMCSEPSLTPYAEVPAQLFSPNSKSARRQEC